MAFPRSTTIQTIIFDRKKWSLKRAKKWLDRHDKIHTLLDTTARYYRFRQVSPSNFVKRTFRTIDIGPGTNTGIKAVIGMKKLKKNPVKKPKARLPRRLVMLGRCVEIQFVDGTVWKPSRRRADLCSTESGKTLWVVQVSREKTHKQPSSDLYEAFHGYYVSGTKTAKIREPSKLQKSQKVHAVVYESDKWDKKKREYIHTFKTKPHCYADNIKRPTFLKISGAKIRVKPEGITG